MTRQSKQGKRRNLFPRRPKAPAVKTGPQQDNLPKGFKEHENVLEGKLSTQAFIPKIK